MGPGTGGLADQLRQKHLQSYTSETKVIQHFVYQELEPFLAELQGVKEFGKDFWAVGAYITADVSRAALAILGVKEWLQFSSALPGMSYALQAWEELLKDVEVREVRSGYRSHWHTLVCRCMQVHVREQ